VPAAQPGGAGANGQEESPAAAADTDAQPEVAGQQAAVAGTTARQRLLRASRQLQPSLTLVGGQFDAANKTQLQALYPPKAKWLNSCR
jgi:hypothetical protein